MNHPDCQCGGTKKAMKATVGEVPHTCHSGAEEAETGGSGVQSQPRLRAVSQREAGARGGGGGALAQ